MGIHFLAAVAQVTRAVGTSEPCAFDASHAPIADCSCMDKRRKVCCGIHENQKETFRNETKKDNLWGRHLAEGQLEDDS
jgi:hypothetical protein